MWVAVLGAFALLLAGAVCWRGYRLRTFSRTRAAADATQTTIQATIQTTTTALVEARQAQYAEELAQIGRRLEALEQNARNIDAASNGSLTRSMRAQAIQLLRSGMSPDHAASALGIGKREMRLIAKVSRILTLQ